MPGGRDLRAGEKTWVFLCSFSEIVVHLFSAPDKWLDKKGDTGNSLCCAIPLVSQSWLEDARRFSYEFFVRKLTIFAC